MNWQFEIYQTSVKGFRWKLRDPKGELVCMSDKSFPTFDAAKKEVKAIQSGVLRLKIIDMDSPKEVKKRGGGKSSRKETQPKDKPTQREIDEKKAEKK